MSYTIIVRSMILMFVMATFHSCKDKKQEYLLQESVKRLEQQNKIIIDNNRILRNQFDKLINADFPASRIGYLENDAKKFYEICDYFLGKIETAIKSEDRSDIKHLYRDYTVFQTYYRQLKNKIIDRFKNIPLDSGINAFMDLNEKSFAQKYLNSDNKNNINSRLKILETDVLLNECYYLENIISYLSPACLIDFNIETATVSTDKCIYKKGDSLKITTFVVKYAPDFNGEAIIDGQDIKIQNGIFEYSRIINESPGLYTVPIKIIWLNSKSEQKSFPAQVTYRVE